MHFIVLVLWTQQKEFVLSFGRSAPAILQFLETFFVFHSFSYSFAICAAEQNVLFVIFIPSAAHKS